MTRLATLAVFVIGLLCVWRVSGQRWRAALALITLLAGFSAVVYVAQLPPVTSLSGQVSATP